VAVGTHVLGNLYGCPKQLLKKVNVVKAILEKTVTEAKFNSVGNVFHQFTPFGVTGVFILTESHLSIHTWPEKNFATVDVFTCGKEGNAEIGFEILCKYFKPNKVEKQVVHR